MTFYSIFEDTVGHQQAKLNAARKATKRPRNLSGEAVSFQYRGQVCAAKEAPLESVLTTRGLEVRAAILHVWVVTISIDRERQRILLAGAGRPIVASALKTPVELTKEFGGGGAVLVGQGFNLVQDKTRIASMATRRRAARRGCSLSLALAPCWRGKTTRSSRERHHIVFEVRLGGHMGDLI